MVWRKITKLGQGLLLWGPPAPVAPSTEIGATNEEVPPDQPQFPPIPGMTGFSRTKGTFGDHNFSWEVKFPPLYSQLSPHFSPHFSPTFPSLSPSFPLPTPSLSSSLWSPSFISLISNTDPGKVRCPNIPLFPSLKGENQLQQKIIEREVSNPRCPCGATEGCHISSGGNLLPLLGWKILLSFSEGFLKSRLQEFMKIKKAKKNPSLPM